MLIFLGIWTLVIIGGFYRNHRKERRKIKTWFASQTAEAVISGRRKAAEKGRALLEKQIDCDNFIEEFGRSEDPEIQSLVSTVNNMSVEDDEFRSAFRKSIEKRIRVLESKDK